MDEGVYVGSGSFKLARSKALEKLAQFQLAEKDRALLSWIRAASAGGASFIRVSREGGGLLLEFNGAPLERAALADPYAALLSEDDAPDLARRRQLGLGLLAAWNLRASRVEIDAGTGPARFRLSAAGPESEALSALPGDGSIVRVHIQLDRRSGAALGGCLARLRESCRLTPCAVELEGVAAPWGPPPGTVRLSGDRRGWIALAADPEGERAKIALYSLGVLAGAVEHASPAVCAEGAIDDDAFRLDASQAGVVEDPALAGALRAFDEQVATLLRDMAQRQRERMAGLGKAIAASPRLRARWAAISRPDDAPNPAPGPLERLGERVLLGLGLEPKLPYAPAELEEEVRRTRLLRRLALRAASREGKVRDALWAVPLFLDPRGAPLSLAQIEKFRRARGTVRLVCNPAPAGAPNTVWLLDQEDREDFERFFTPEQIERDWEPPGLPD
ncbi:MAG TPA: hypothetical protein VNI01_09440 [Elusimicrobiota bacterium]|nr:hypothetical protein [Elusimicrobiota bacterium]